MAGTPKKILTLWSAIGFCSRYWWPHRLRLALVIALTVAYTGIDVLVPMFSGRLVTALTEDGPPEAAWAALGGILACGLGFWVLRYLALRVWLPVTLACMQQLVEDGTARVQRFSSAWHANAFAGATVRKITRGMWAYDMIADIVFINMSATLFAVGGIILAISLRFPLVGALVALACVGFTLASIAIARLWVDPAMRDAADTDSAATAVMADSITCNPVVKAFGAELREDARIHAAYGRWRQANHKAWGRMEHAITFQGGLMLTLYATILGLGIWMWQSGQATPGEVVFLMTSHMLIAAWLRMVGEHVRNLQRSVNEIEDLVLFLRTEPDLADASDAVPFCPGAGEIRFERVSFHYQPERPIYQDLDLVLKAGEVVALVGQSGSGKSTLVKLIQRMHDIQGGRILIDGQDIAHVTQASLRQAIALVPQDPVLFHRSLAENIAYARPDASMAEIQEAARRAQADGFIRHLPLGYDTLVGERGIKLSGGERQRIAIARAILSRAPILILDEATSSLDSVAEAEIQAAVEEATKGRTAILIAHRLSTIRRADRILVFAQGRIVEEGRHEDLVTLSGGLYRMLYEKQALGLLLPAETGGEGVSDALDPREDLAAE